MNFNELCDYVKSHNEAESQSEMMKAFMTSEITSKEMDKLKAQLDAKKTAESRCSEDWMKSLEYDKNGKVLKTQENLDLIAANIDVYKNAAYNEFDEEIQIDGETFTDNDANEMYRQYAMSPYCLNAKDRIDVTFRSYAYRNKYNPLKKIIENTVWDGKKRMETLFIDKLKVDDTKLNRTMTKIWLLAAIKRLYEPGCPFDSMIVLVGAQGVGKTKLVHKLGLEKYAADIDFDIVNSKAREQTEYLNSTWIANFDEMANFSVREIGQVKTFLTKTNDKARMAYGRYTAKYNRHTVFIGGTNEEVFLKDSTSGLERRFWTMKVNNTVEDGIKMVNETDDEYILQVWAETLQMYREGQANRLFLPYELNDELEKQQMPHKLQYNDSEMVPVIEMLARKDWYLNENGNFRNLDDFLEQALHRTTYTTAQGVINKLPMSYITAYMKALKWAGSRSEKWIGRALEPLGWKYQSIRYDNMGVCKGLVQQSPAPSNSLFTQNM